MRGSRDLAVYRLYRLRSNKAFTLAETVISMVLTAVASLLLLSSVSVTANMISMSAELRREISAAEDALYKSSAEYTVLRPAVKKTAYSYEDMSEHPYLKIYRYGDTENGMELVYYCGEYGGEDML